MHRVCETVVLEVQQINRINTAPFWHNEYHDLPKRGIFYETSIDG